MMSLSVTVTVGMNLLTVFEADVENRCLRVFVVMCSSSGGLWSEPHVSCLC